MKEPTIADIEDNPWAYVIWVLLEGDRAIRMAKHERGLLQQKRNELAKARRK